MPVAQTFAQQCNLVHLDQSPWPGILPDGLWSKNTWAEGATVLVVVHINVGVHCTTRLMQTAVPGTFMCTACSTYTDQLTSCALQSLM